MVSYKARLTEDLDRWIAAGLAPASSRDAILDGVSEPRRLDAATAMAVVGALLLGVAVIAFVAANWDGIPRVGRFGVLLAAFLAACAGAAFASGRERPVLRNTLLSVAAMVYAASIGLTGQIFDIAGDPKTALRSAGIAAAVLALAGRSSGAAAVALILLGMGDFARLTSSFLSPPPPSYGWLAFAAPAGVALALLWRSPVLAHVAGLAAIVAGFTYLPAHPLIPFMATAAVFAALAVAARWISARTEPAGAILMGWFVIAALVFFFAGGFELKDEAQLAHRAAWMALSGGVIAYGRHARHTVLTGVGVLSMAGAVTTILMDLGLELMTAAGLFAACAVAALLVGWLLRGRAQKAAGS